VVERQEGWARIRTADDYTGWTPLSALLPGKAYAASGRVAEVASLFAHIYRERSVTAHAPLLTVPFESRLEVVAEPSDQARWLQVRLPDDRSGWVQAGDVAFDAKPLSIPEMIEFSKRFLGLPYTWGGTSSFGYDCSGFAQMLCRRRGILMPRDAQPQADWSGVDARRAQGPEAGRPALFRRLGEEDHPHRRVFGRRQVHRRHHLADAHGADRRFERRPLVAAAGGDAESEMNRRNFLRTAAVAPAGPLLAAPPGPSIETKILRLNLQHTWTTTMSSSQYRDTLHVAYTRDGITGHGEGAPIVRYHEDAESARKAVESVRALLLSANPMQFAKVMAEVFRRVPGEWAGKAAIDIALMDWVGQKLGIPLYTYFGLDPKDTPLTTFSIGIDTPEITKQKTREAADFPILKVKVGLATDEPTIEAVRSVTKKPLRVDANEGWKDKEEAVRKINWLEKMGVEFIEQPMPAEMIEETRWVRGRVHIPIIADEACQRASDIPKLKDAFDGVNVKLDKSGGMLEAYRMIQIAKALGMKTMLGCMVSSSVSVTAAAHLSPLVDYADLDGNLLISNDPFRGVLVEKGKLVLPKGAGLGLTRA
jgi:L-alanine-DL-glutamate epimerase-like enolase superfamily enzyme